MKRSLLVFLVVVPAAARAQVPEDAGARFNRPYYPRIEPVITRVELAGPLPPAEFQQRFRLTPEQMAAYTAVYDSFATATNATRDSAQHRVDQLNQAFGRDSAAADYYRERLKQLGKTLRDAQSRLDDRLKRILSRDQQKQYRDWREEDEKAAKAEATGSQPHEFGRPGLPSPSGPNP